MEAMHEGALPVSTSLSLRSSFLKRRGHKLGGCDISVQRTCGPGEDAFNWIWWSMLPDGCSLVSSNLDKAAAVFGGKC